MYYATVDKIRQIVNSFYPRDIAAIEYSARRQGPLAQDGKIEVSGGRGLLPAEFASFWNLENLNEVFSEACIQ